MGEISEGDRRDSRSVGKGHRLRLRRRPHLSAVRVVKVVWDRPVGDLSVAEKFLQGVAHVQLGFRFVDPLQEGVSHLPDKLLILDLGLSFRHDISGMVWPAGLRELNLGASFDRPISDVVLPSDLRRLTFGASFNKPINGVVWPASLRVLEFGRRFDQPVATDVVSWPERLESLSFGRDFSHDLGVASETESAGTVAMEAAPTVTATATDSRGRDWWPASLRRLELSEGFRQPIDTVAWPEALEELQLDCVSVREASAGTMAPGCGSAADRSIAWPRGLKRLSFDLSFHQPVEDVPLPPALEGLAFGDKFNQPIHGVRWPRGLKEISFGASFNQTIEGVTFPPSLERLAFGYRFDRSLERVRWPPGLERLVFRDHFNQPINGVVAWPSSLRTLKFGWRFNQPLPGGASFWPPHGLERLILGKNFDQPVECLVLPPGLVFMEFGQGCRQRLRGITWPPGLRDIVVGRCGKMLADEGLGGLPKGCRVRRS